MIHELKWALITKKVIPSQRHYFIGHTPRERVNFFFPPTHFQFPLNEMLEEKEKMGVALRLSEDK